MANTLVEQSRAGQELLNILMPTDNLLKAYVNEYGEELMNELLDDEDVVEGEVEERDMDDYDYGVVDETGEIVDEETEETGLAGEDDGLDAQTEEQES